MAGLDKGEVISMSVTSLAKIYQLILFLHFNLLSDTYLPSDSVPLDRQENCPQPFRGMPFSLNCTVILGSNTVPGQGELT